MRKSQVAVEMRFLVPPHKIEAAKQAMALLLIEEIPEYSGKQMPITFYPPHMLTNQELKVLLRE